MYHGQVDANKEMSEIKLNTDTEDQLVECNELRAGLTGVTKIIQLSRCSIIFGEFFRFHL